MAHTYAAIYHHIIFSTKGRRRLIAPDLSKRLYSYMGGIVRNEGGLLLAADGIEDHSHLLASLPPRLSVSATVRKIKANSTRWVRLNFENRHSFEWQTGYSVFTVGRREIPGVERYIAGQRQHHMTETYLDELRRMLRLHGLPFDEKDLLA